MWWQTREYQLKAEKGFQWWGWPGFIRKKGLWTFETTTMPWDTFSTHNHWEELHENRFFSCSYKIKLFCFMWFLRIFSLFWLLLLIQKRAPCRRIFNQSVTVVHSLFIITTITNQRKIIGGCLSFPSHKH